MLAPRDDGPGEFAPERVEQGRGSVLAFVRVPGEQVVDRDVGDDVVRPSSGHVASTTGGSSANGGGCPVSPRNCSFVTHETGLTNS